MIDTQTSGSPGWWMLKLARKLEERRPRLQDLRNRYEGDPPLPQGAEPMRDAYRAFQQKSRTNFAELVVETKANRMLPVGFRTAAGDDEAGDAEARRIWEANDLDVEFSEVRTNMLACGDAYMIVGGPDPDTGAPVITAEDPRQVVTIHDPRQQRKVRAALKLFHDPDEQRDLAYLYLPGEVWVATRSVKRLSRGLPPRFNAGSWDWDAELTDEVPYPVVPVVRFRNKNGRGEYEGHLDLMDRINHQVLQRMVVASMQAFRQRALLGAPEYDEKGNLIDYDGLLAGPGELWDLPEGVNIWESQQVDLTPILAAVDKDVRHLAAVTSTPLHIFSPDAANGSAEGASLLRDELVSAVEDRLKRATGALKDVMSMAFLFGGDAVRADRGRLEVLWAPPERRSLAERADAESKAQALPLRTRLAYIWGMSPQQIDQTMAERAEDAFSAPVVVGDIGSSEGSSGMDSAEVKAAADAMGVLIRAGVEPADAAARVGLSGVRFTGAVPTSLRLPQTEAEGLEDGG